jgi:hypothetical protein
MLNVETDSLQSQISRSMINLPGISNGWYSQEEKASVSQVSPAARREQHMRLTKGELSAESQERRLRNYDPAKQPCKQGNI